LDPYLFFYKFYKFLDIWININKIPLKKWG
jgi:hypothetical protein